jgi:hypothetical protein
MKPSNQKIFLTSLKQTFYYSFGFCLINTFVAIIYVYKYKDNLGDGGLILSFLFLSFLSALIAVIWGITYISKSDKAKIIDYIFAFISACHILFVVSFVVYSIYYFLNVVGPRDFM